MGQPDTVNQLPDFNPKFDVVEKLLAKLYNTLSLWDKMPTNGVKAVTFNLFRNKMSYTSVKMSKTIMKFQFTLSSPLRF